MESDQPNEVLAVIHVVVADMPGKAAYSYTDSRGERVICTDRAVIQGDPAARESAFQVFVTQATDALGDSAA